MATAFLVLLIPALGYAAGTGFYDTARRPRRNLLRQALTTAAWLLALWAFDAAVRG